MSPHRVRRAVREAARGLVPLALAGCASVGGSAPSASARELAGYMSGTFSSAAQAQADPEFYEVRLVVHPIWAERSDGPWLYVEQALASALERPYRQRVYRLVEVAGGVRSDVFELPGDPLDLVAAWEREAPFAAFAPTDLLAREGCSLLLRREPDGAYVGATAGSACASTLRGATYATSQARIAPDRLESWDRGFDAAGRQVWGAVAGPYVFERVAPVAEAP